MVELLRKLVLLCLVKILLISSTLGHGMLLDPVGRASRWRYNSSAPKNYDDNAMYCGGYWQHWGVNGGQCGLCGDDYNLPTPRPHEMGGLYGSGVIVKSYPSGTVISVEAHITVSHMGYFFFELCNLDTVLVESEACFQNLNLENGNEHHPITSTPGHYVTNVQLPQSVFCEHCVFRWTYVTGNNWGICEDGSGGLGCGPQETFKSCADIRISDSKVSKIPDSLEAAIPEEV